MGEKPSEKHRNVVLGIDLGTTSVKVVLYDADNNCIIRSESCETNAAIDRAKSTGAAEQNIQKILTACDCCVTRLNDAEAGYVSMVRCIGIAGQMHGCVCWRVNSDESQTEEEEEEEEEDTSQNLSRIPINGCSRSITASPVITWQDARCTEGFIASLPTPASHLRVATGHGCATLFWLQRNSPGFMTGFNRAGTLMDLLVAVLCGLDAPVMSVQNAASWGYFDVSEKQWNTKILSAAGFPTYLLPEVKDPGTIVGQLRSPWCGIQAGCQVAVAMGDLPCSVLASIQTITDAVVNISTSAQLVTITPDDFDPHQISRSQTVEYFPYFGGRYLAVSAALTGGNVLACLVHAMCQLAGEFGCNITEEEAYKKLIEKGSERHDTDLNISPTIYGERHQPGQRGSVLQLTRDNATIGDVSRALCRGVVTNLHGMMSREELLARGITRIVGCGNALLRNQVMKEELERVFGIPVVYRQGGDAALGAAMALLLP